jgi:phosphoribosyl 1,2-cyclic phosphodiesterase
LSLRVCSLGSGSRGNATLIESGSTLLLVDCGLSRRQLEGRMRVAGREIGDLTALLVTHEHSDHSQGIGPLIGRHEIPVWATPGTASVIASIDYYASMSLRRPFEIGSIEVLPFAVPHDAREPCQFVFQSHGKRIGLLTDTGHVTAHIVERLADCDALAIEFNHDLDSLLNGPYPPAVKSRVASDFGHLNNEQASALVSRVAHDGLQWVLGLHLSERNNSPARVLDCLAPLTDTASFAVTLARQDAVTDWLELA